MSGRSSPIIEIKVFDHHCTTCWVIHLSLIFARIASVINQRFFTHSVGNVTRQRNQCKDKSPEWELYSGVSAEEYALPMLLQRPSWKIEYKISIV